MCNDAGEQMSAEEAAWAAISFFASDADVQIAYLHGTDIAFLAPSTGASREANHMAGLYGLYVLCATTFRHVYRLPDESVIDELKSALSAAFVVRPAAVWEPSQLPIHHAWREIPALAAAVLVEAGLPPRSPEPRLDVGEAAYEFEWREPPDV